MKKHKDREYVDNIVGTQGASFTYYGENKNCRIKITSVYGKSFLFLLKHNIVLYFRYRRRRRMMKNGR